MQHLTFKATTTDRELGEFEAIAAAWTVDRQHEQIVPGAFARSIARWQGSNKQIPLHWSHGGSAEDIIGSCDPATMSEDEPGLRVVGRLDLEGSAVAREAWRSVKANALGLSFGFLATKTRKRRGVTELLEVDLFEVSLTPSPVNPDTQVLGFKSVDPVGFVGTSDYWHRVGLAQAAWRKKDQPIRVVTFEC